MPRSLRTLLAVVLSLALLSAAIAWQNAGKTEGPIDKIAAVQSGPVYWKGNLHTHSLWSDGDDFPEMIADWYKRQGYHFLTLSDHNTLSDGERWIDIPAGKGTREVAVKKYVERFGDAWVEQRTKDVKKDKETVKVNQVRLKPLAEFRSLLEAPGKFLLIPGEEITHKFAKNPVHMNAINIRDVVTPSDGASVAETISVNLRVVEEQRKKRGWKTIAFLNHPNFGWGVKAEDMLTEELKYFEIYNGHPSVRNYGDDIHVSTERMWDILLALRLGKHGLPIVYGLATDDAHAYHVYGVGKTNPGRGFIMVRAPYLTAEAMVRGMEAGDYYCSTGVTLKDVRRAGKELALVIQPQKDVKYKTQFIATMKDAKLTSEPRLDEDGKVLDVTRNYHADVGKVVAETESLEPSYRLTGKELYVRAKVISTKLHPNPYEKGDVEVAWTQPLTP
jgi:predicted metal-dependent phosphoesterase TrpH